MYLYGSQFIYITIAVVFCALTLHFVIIPVFHELQITSTYEVIDKTPLIYFYSLILNLFLQYLQGRFDKRMRLFGKRTL